MHPLHPLPHFTRIALAEIVSGLITDKSNDTLSYLISLWHLTQMITISLQISSPVALVSSFWFSAYICGLVPFVPFFSTHLSNVGVPTGCIKCSSRYVLIHLLYQQSRLLSWPIAIWATSPREPMNRHILNHYGCFTQSFWIETFYFIF